jgi:hypothetical protein
VFYLHSCAAFIIGTFLSNQNLNKRLLIHCFPHSLLHSSLLCFQNSTVLTNQALLSRYSAKESLTITHALSTAVFFALEYIEQERKNCFKLSFDFFAIITVANSTGDITQMSFYCRIFISSSFK